MADATIEQKTRKPFIESVAEYLTEEERLFDRDEEGGNTINAKVRGERAVYRMRFVARETGSLLTFLVFGPTFVPDEVRPQVLELLNLVNTRYWVGNFALMGVCFCGVTPASAVVKMDEKPSEPSES